MHHFEKKNLKKISLEGPCENVWELHEIDENVSPGPAVALDRPDEN